MRPSLAATAVCIAALALTACGDTIQDRPIARSALEPMVLSRHYPVYWLGGVFHRLAITEATHDPGGAYTINYGDCTVGGQYTCVHPLAIVTSPDNSFLPGGSGAGEKRPTVALRGVQGFLAQQGTTIAIPTSGVVVSIYAKTPQLARAAAATMVPINRIGLPGEALPPPLPDTGFGAEPLPSQEPAAVRLPGTPGAAPQGAGTNRRAARARR